MSSTTGAPGTRRAIPGTDLEPSVICLGTALLGTGIARDDSFRLLDAYVEAGGSFIDTAHCYADWLGGERSVSEKTIGAWMRSRGARGSVVLATKGAHPDLRTMQPRLAPREIARDLQQSLEYLGVESIDLYWLHRDEPGRPVGEILGALEEHARSRRIRFYGCSNWTARRMAEARELAARAGFGGFVASQNMWSLARPAPGAVGDRTLVQMGSEEIAFHGRYGVAAVPYSSQAGGYFTKLERGTLEPGQGIAKIYDRPGNRRRYERAASVARRHGWSAGDVVLAYLLSQEFPVYPIVGCRTVEQLDASMGAAALRLDPEELEGLEGRRPT
jgi:aryl-alcohol dehydrogenase-like predicted oxidoreductase